MFVVKFKHNMIFFLLIRSIDRHTINVHCFCSNTGNIQKGDKLEKDENFKKGDITFSKV